MKETLSQLTVDQFVELICGNIAVLKEKGEKVSSEKLVGAMRNIIFEYKDLADNAGTKSYLLSVEDLIKAKITVLVCSICQNLVSLGEHGHVREVLLEYGIKAGALTDQRIEAEVRSRLERARSTIARIEEQKGSDRYDAKYLRREFDAQTAALMAYFRFQINPSRMKATVYANLVSRHNREIKAQMSVMKKR